MFESKPTPNAAEVLHRRKQLFVNTARQCNKDRVPLLSNTRQYPFYDAGYTTSEALSDYDKIHESLCRFHEKYEFDAYWDLGRDWPILWEKFSFVPEEKREAYIKGTIMFIGMS